jgi:protocatechuate 3,4-dioxygenase beta subunit
LPVNTSTTVAAITSFALAALPAQAPERRAPVQGRVVDVHGEPIPAASIVAMAGDEVVGRTTTDGDGIYHLARIPEAGAELRVAATGKAELRVACRDPASQRICNLTLEDGCRLRGRVLDAAGQPVAGAAVLAVVGQQTWEARSAADGGFEFPSVPMQNATVRGIASGRSVQRELRLVTDTACDLVLPDAPAGLRIVRVRGLPADAVPRTRIEVTAPDLALQPGRGHLPLRGDCSAEFVVREACLLRVVAPGFAPTPEGVLIDAKGHLPVEFAMRPAPAGPPAIAMLRGRVVDLRDLRVAGLRLVGQDRSERTVGSTRIGPDGRFVLPVELAAGEFLRVGLELGDFVIADDEVRVENGFSWIDVYAQPAETLDLSLEPAGGIRGELRTASGQRCAFAEVTIAATDGPDHVIATAITDHRGAFTARGLPATTCLVTAVAATGEVLTAEVEVRERAVVAIEGFTAVPAGTIEGCVRNADGGPVPGARVQLWCTAVEAPLGLCMRQVITDRHGRFRCRGAVCGEWRASVAPDPVVVYAAVDVGAGAIAAVELQALR